MDNTLDALRNLYIALGGNIADVENLVIIPDLINALANLIGVGEISVLPEDSSSELFGTAVSDMQSGIVISNNAITGTLKYLSSGSLVTTFGAGNFIALKFVNPNENIKSIRVGLNPSEGTGLVELDADMNGVFKITNKDTQVFEVVSTDGTTTKTQTFDLSGLTLANS